MIALAFAQTASSGQGTVQSAVNPIMNFMPIIIIFVIFYFLLIRPQKKQQENHKKMLSELKKNDEVMTSGGIYGTIVNIQDDIVTMRVDENTRIKVQKSSVASVKSKKQEK